MKAVPEGRVPIEGWQIIMESSKLAAARITKALNNAYEKGRIPKKWQLSKIVQLGKNNCKEGTRVVRLINPPCPVGKMFYNMDHWPFI